MIIPLGSDYSPPKIRENVDPHEAWEFKRQNWLKTPNRQNKKWFLRQDINDKLDVDSDESFIYKYDRNF